MKQDIVITEFIPEHQTAIDVLLDGIQKEFPESIYGPGSKKMTDVAFLPGRKYWVALDNNNVIGTIGIVLLENNSACLKSMMLQKEYRGTQVANTLLIVAINHAISQHARQVFLGTMIQFKAAQLFYLKHSFIEIQESSLPGDFMKNPVDRVFFKLAMAEMA